MTLKFEDVCNGSKKIGLNTVRNLCLDEWVGLWMNEQFGGLEDDYFSDDGVRENLLDQFVSFLNNWEEENSVVAP